MSPELELDKWHNLYADRMIVAKSSAVRDLMGAISRPDIISLAGGFPNTSLFNKKTLRSISEKVFVKDVNKTLQYCSSEGLYPLKEEICKLMLEDGIDASPEEVIITVGAQQALELITKIFINPNDNIIIEEPSYVGALNSFHGFQASFTTIPMDNNGMKTDLLERELSNGIGEAAKFLYTIPNFHNPAGITLSAERRQHLIELSKEYEFIIVEDNAYGRLFFYDPPPPPLRSLNDDVIYIGSFSKIFSPGPRVGWILAPLPIINKINTARQSADLCPGTTTQHLIYEFLKTNELNAHIEKLRTVYKERCETMLTALDKYFPDDVSWTKPKGGFYVWVTLPSFLDANAMLAEAISKGVAYIPGSGFYPDEKHKNTIRLAFCFAEPEKIKKAIKILGKIITEQMKLYKSLKF